MKSKKKLIISICAGLVFSNVIACSCMYLDKDSHIDGSEIIFYGKVLSISESNKNNIYSTPQTHKLDKNIQMQNPTIEKNENQNRNQNRDLYAKFKIIKLYKGKLIGKKIQIKYSEGNGVNCGWNFKAGEETFVFANLEKNQPTTNLCMMGGINLFKNNEDIKNTILESETQ